MSGHPSFLFAGGGTGGHVFPALAIAEALRARYSDAEITFAGSPDRIEARLARDRGYAFRGIWISGLKRRFHVDTILLPIKILVSLVQSARILRTCRPWVVIGTGGYVSGPVLAAAHLLGYPTVIQEQNGFPGITTRLLARFADETHLTFAESARHLTKARKIVVSGNPVRPSLQRIEAREARRRLGLDPDASTLFVFGGSLGARSINRAVERGMADLCRAGIQLVWQTGAADAERAQQVVDEVGARAVVLPFLEDMDLGYSAADLVVCRAGATSLAELTVLGCPALLVPYPHATADHQRANAQALVDHGAAVMVDDAEVDRVPAVALDLLSRPDALHALAEAARSMGRPEAANTLADAILALASSSTRRTP